MRHKAHVTVRRQRRIQGGREQISGGVDKRINRAIVHTMRVFNVTKRFVVTEALADFFGIALDEETERMGRGKGGK